MHDILSNVGNCYNENLEELLTAALDLTKVRYPFLKDLTLYKNKIKSFINNNQFRDLFFVKQGNIFREKEFVNKFGHTKRIDRLIVKQDEVLVVDYKISKYQQENHQKQIDEYISIVKGIYPDKIVQGRVVYL